MCESRAPRRFTIAFDPGYRALPQSGVTPDEIAATAADIDDMRRRLAGRRQPRHDRLDTSSVRWIELTRKQPGKHRRNVAGHVGVTIALERAASTQVPAKIASYAPTVRTKLNTSATASRMRT